jgi:hypothetical protein
MGYQTAGAAVSAARTMWNGALHKLHDGAPREQLELDGLSAAVRRHEVCIAVHRLLIG